MSGVHFAVHLRAAAGGLLLCPFISLVLKDGQEVGLVGDALGPVPLTDDFLVDFAAVDQGRNLQLDIIFRQKSGKSTEKPHDWTLRTCLRDFTSFNNREPKQIYFASSAPDACQVHLQNLVASEEACGTAPIGTTPSWVKTKEQCGEATNDGPIIFEGTAEALVVGETQRRSSRSTEFWHHMVFDMVHGRASPSGVLEKTQGEFWMSKRAMNMQPLYIYCKLTVAQATVSCISLRFSCQKDYLDMLQNTPTTLQFKYPHIPSRGVIMGVEQDPRNPRLIRMFIEYRNEILEDMILCEIDPAQAHKIFVQQEIWDTIESFPQSRVELCWWFDEASVQFRIAGRGLIADSTTQDPELRAVRSAVWQRLKASTKETFFWPHPGRPRDVPNQAVSSTDLEDAHFAVVVILPSSVDELHLGGRQKRKIYRSSFKEDYMHLPFSELYDRMAQLHWEVEDVTP